MSRIFLYVFHQALQWQFGHTPPRSRASHPPLAPTAPDGVNITLLQAGPRSATAISLTESTMTPIQAPSASRILQRKVKDCVAGVQ